MQMHGFHAKWHILQYNVLPFKEHTVLLRPFAVNDETQPETLSLL